MDNLIRELREAGDSVGGVISARICGLPAGLGEPVFGKFNAMLGHAMLSIPAVKGFELGEGFHAAELTGSQHNDPISSFLPNGNALTVTNHAGGVLGGITNGEDVTFRVAFKPIASISRPQTTLNRQGEKVSLEIKGRHDVCPVPRAVPIVEGLAALVTADFILRQYAHEKAVQQKGSVEGLFST